jgi:hypothetical protein
MPTCFAHVEPFLQRHDADLRIRRSLTHPGHFVLERRCRRQPAVNTGMRLRSDHHLQARDGYIHVSTVHSSWLERPWRIVEALKEEGADLWATPGGLQRIEDEEAYERQWAAETRRRKRLQKFRDIFREGREVMRRLGAFGERDRISNAGMPAET